DREDKLLGGAGIRSGFEGNELAALKMRLNHDGGLLDVAEIRLAALIERSRDADDDGVYFFQLRGVAGRGKVAAVDELLNFRLRDVLDVRLSGVEGVDFLLIGVKAGDFVSGFGETQRQRQAHVAASDDSYFELGAFEKLWLSVGRHVFGRTPLV